MSTLTLNDIAQISIEMSSSIDAQSWFITMKTYKRLQYFSHLSAACLFNPPYKIRKCHMRSLAKQRRAARRKYL